MEKSDRLAWATLGDGEGFGALDHGWGLAIDFDSHPRVPRWPVEHDVATVHARVLARV